MSKMSAGPWRWYGEDGDGRPGVLLDGKGTAIIEGTDRVDGGDGSSPLGAWVSGTDADARAIARVPEMVELLRKHQWAVDSMECPECMACRYTIGEPRPGYGRHEEGCALAAILAYIDGEGP